MPHNEHPGVLEEFARYTQAFRSLDARAVAQHFHEPALFITPKEIVSLPTVQTVEQAHARVMSDLPPDYVRTEFSPLSVHRLSDDLAMVSGSGAWKNAANKDLRLMAFGMTYTLRRAADTWRIVVGAMDAPDGRLGR